MPNVVVRSDGAGKEGDPKRFTLRHRLLRVAKVDGKHRFVVFGKPTPRLPVLSRYTDLLDRESRLPGKGSGRKTGRPVPVTAVEADDLEYYLVPEHRERLSVEEMVTALSAYDIVSFDVFDTALFRTVEFPNDVLRVMGARLGVETFARQRKSAEAHARLESLRYKGSREVTLTEIYAVMEQRYGADPKWAEFEKALELEFARPNPFIKEVFDQLKALGKVIVFMTDMYLPRDLIEEMLIRNGYQGFHKIYLSNEHLLRKGDGSLQRALLEDCGERTVIHVGDVLESDVIKSEWAGLSAVYNPDPRGVVRESDMASLAGSFYGAVINNAIGSGTWSKDHHYTHGFRVGGILALGFCEFIEKLALEKSIDQILFCGRDCDVLFRVYREFFGAKSSAYLDVSRYALTGLTLDRNFDDFMGRSFWRWFKESDNSKTLEQLFIETGFDYLLPYLDEADIERFLFPSTANRRKLESFFWTHKHLVEKHNQASVTAAKDYFANKLGDAKRVLVVDIGWSGSSAATLRHFFRTNMAESKLEVYGALMCTSRTEQLTDTISSGFLSAYVYSPLANMDLARFMMPSGQHPVRTTDLLHHSLEFMFTEAQATVVGYGRDSLGKPIPLRGNNMPGNTDQIAAMQQGIIDFVRAYQEYSRGYTDLRPISAYVAFNPLRRAIQNDAYSYSVYKDFLYDATPALFGKETHTERFADLFPPQGAPPELTFPTWSSSDSAVRTSRRRILFISPEMIYAGAPRSLLRMCKVAIAQEFQPMVWTVKSGPFVKEFAALGIPVQVVKPSQARQTDVAELLRDGLDLVVANTVVTDAYVRVFEGRVPLVWYVREASNLPDFCRSNPRRIETLRSSRSICCVSNYAAEAIAKYADGPIEVVHNTVEDVSALALPYSFSKERKHRFVQLGTIEHRKGYDLLVAAFTSLPRAYRERAELHFAGGFVNSGASFASYLFGQTANVDDIHFHGLISDEGEKIQLLSQMDTVVVASRDESFSLVALEGAMLAKPLIVTENVGAKYLVSDENGLVIRSGSVDALRQALMSMIDMDEPTVSAMGAASRRTYDERASMAAYTKELGDLFRRRIEAGPVAPRPRKPATPDVGLGLGRQPRPELIVSLTSIPSRLPSLVHCVDSLFNQTLQPDRIILWLSTKNFPNRDDELPAELLDRRGDRFRIEWVEDDLAPHKKYFYAMQKYPEAIVITTDDDVIYGERTVANLYASHQENPHAVICERANLVMFRPNGTLRDYDGWVYDCQHLRATTTYQLLPTGVGGVLYPPNSIPTVAFDKAAIIRTSLFADDLWLKVMATANGYPVWMPRTKAGYEQIEEAQAVGLWRTNALQGQNDVALRRILAFYDGALGSSDALLRRMRGIGNDGQMLGPDEIDTASLLGGALERH